MFSYVCLLLIGFLLKYSSVAEFTTEVGCRMDNMGSEFAVAFINNLDDNGTYRLEIYPTSFQHNQSIINVSAKVVDGSEWRQTVQLQPGRSVMINVPPEVELQGSELARKAVIVTTDDGRNVGVYGMSSAERGSCDGFVALPTRSLGTEYYALCYFPPDYYTEIGIVAVEDDTTVYVTLRELTRPGVQLKWNDTTYIGGQKITIQLNRYEAVQLRVTSDLTGTRITSNRPVAVFSGNDDALVGEYATASHLVEQLPPVDYWGYTFYLLSLPGGSSGYAYKLLTAETENNVEQRLAGSMFTDPVTLSNPGDYFVDGEATGRPLTIRSSKPLLVAQFAGGSTIETGHRAMMLIPPSELFRPWYSFSTGNSDFEQINHYVVLIANSSALPGLRLDNQPVNVSDWLEFDPNGDDDMVGRVFPVTVGMHVVVQLDAIPFGAYVFGHSPSTNCSYAFAAGLCLGTPNNLTTFPPLTPTSGPSTTPTNSSITDCSCLTLTSTVQADYSGQYYRSSTSSDSYYFRPGNGNVTSSSARDCQLYMFTLQEEFSSWVVGPTLGGRQGALIGQPSLLPPYAISSWRAWSHSHEIFVDDQSASVVCSCSALSRCKSVEIVDRITGSSLYAGVFWRLQSSYLARPVFQFERQHPPLYVYYVDNLGCGGGAWTVGKTIGNRNVSMYADDDAVDPALMDRNVIWNVFNWTIKEFQPETRLTLVCYSD